MQQQIRILLVDDSKTVHSFVQNCLKSTRAVLEHVYDGQQALEWLGLQGPVDLIIMDWEMPVLTGPEAVARIKQKGIKTPIMMLTSKNHPEEIAQMLKAGVVDYMIKPFTPDILIQKSEDILGCTLSSTKAA